MDLADNGLSEALRQTLMAGQEKVLASLMATHDDTVNTPPSTPPISLAGSSLVEPMALDEPEVTNSDEEGLFLPSRTATPGPTPAATTPSKHLPSDIIVDTDDESDAHSTEPDSAAEEESEPPPKKKRLNAGKTKAPPKPKGSQPKKKGPKLSKTPRAPKAPKPPKKPKKVVANQQRTNNLVNLAGLYSTNVFRDVANNQGRDQAPTFTAKRKAQVLKQLVDSIPAECRNTAKIDKKQLNDAARALQGHCLADPTTGGWLLTGMKSALTHYQMLGVSFMRGRETGGEEPRGGLLADAMGLGKTVEVIATIINGRADKPGGRKTTLIVVNSSIVMQWQAELNKHTHPKHMGSIIRYHAGCRFDTGTPQGNLEHLMNYDVVLTTYSEIAKSYPKSDCPVEIDNDIDHEEWWNQYFEANKGIFHAAKFKRVILDEAQNIKNHQSHTSKACRALDSVYRWACTATPVMNSLIEFFPYFDFLRVPDSGTYEIFQQNYRYNDNDVTGRDRLHARLRQFMLRRTHNNILMGSKLLSLPKTTFQTYYCHFGDFEKRIYDVVKRRFAERINLIGKQDSKKAYSCALVLLLRLRQLVGHILLIQDIIRDLLTPSDLEEIRMILSTPMGPEFSQESIIRHLRMMLATAKTLPTIDPTPEITDAVANTIVEVGLEDDDTFLPGPQLRPDDMTPGFQNQNQNLEHNNSVENPSPTATKATETPPEVPIEFPLSTGGKFGMKSSHHIYLSQMSDEIASNMEIVVSECSKCHNLPKDPHVTSCGHLYCHGCLLLMSYESAENGEDQSACAKCGDFYTGATITDDGVKQVDGSVIYPEGRKPKKESMKSIINKWVDPKGHMLPSAKTLAVKAQILNWLKEDPEIKIIVYTQFVPMIYILEKLCTMEGWNCLLYHGAQNIRQRNPTLDKFQNDPDVKVLISSLKSGGTGLNLTMASRVILVDLWWNNAMEQQAYCRVFRRGQEKETAMTRIAVSNTVDLDLIRMQERKEKEITSVMVEGRAKMTTNELLGLFGEVGEANGRSFIITGH